MKYPFLFALCCLCITGTCLAQNQAQNTTANKILGYYNAAHYDSIWQLFSGESKPKIPQDKTIEFFASVQSKYGNIMKATYDHNKGHIATYKLNFENGVLALNFGLDKDQMLNGLTITPYVPNDLPSISRNKTDLILPFNGEWTVFWGGDTPEQNHHVNIPSQKNAFDIVITDANGNSYKTDGKVNEDYYAFGKPLIAPCDAVVVQAVDGIKDNNPGDLNPIYTPGNSIMLKTINNEYILIAHFKNHTITVKEGEKVKKGQILGNCGNSGNSSEPHLHFHLENAEDMNIATGVKCYFEKIKVNASEKHDYSPVKGDKVENVN